MSKYRERIYGHYVDAATTPLAPANLDGLASRRPNLARFIADHYPADRNAAILELGCGHGALLHIARSAGYRNISGVDASLPQVEAARRLGIFVSHGDLLPTLKQRAEASLDAVVAYDVIEHLTRDELIDVTDQVLRVLKPGGRWIVHVPNGLSPFAGVIQYGDLTHEIAFTPESLTQLFMSSGFRSARFYEDPPAAHGLKSALRAVLWKLVRQAYRFALAVETGSTEYRVLTMNLTAVAEK